MSAGRSAPPQGVPTLTEVIELGRREPPAEVPVVAVEAIVDVSLAPVPPDPAAAAAAAASLVALEAQLIERVYADVQRQVDLMLEYRMREVLAPALARVSEALISETRNELASTLREVVSRAVAQELSRHRGR